MIYLLGLAIMILLRYFGAIADPYDQNEWIIASWIVSGIAFLITFIVQLNKFYKQAEDIEQITEQRQNRKVYVKRANEYIDEFKLYLAEIYPKHEKELFELMKPENVTAFMIKYPEIKTNETIAMLVNTINKLKNSYYACDTKINELSRQLRVRKRTILLWCLPILPKYQEKITE